LVKSKLKLDQNGVSTAPNQLWRDCNVKSPAKKPQQGLLNAGELRQEGHPGSQGAAFALQIRPLAEDGCVSLMPQQ
jgi:hypothetical protein